LDHQIVGIDHVIIGVRDVEAARARYARLGFNSTPRGRHVGWGTANYCIMFEHDYLELLGIVDAGQFSNGLDRFLERREGLLGLVVGSRDAAATRAAWAAAGASPDEVKPLGRLLESNAGPVELRFRNVLLPRERVGGLSLFACEHLTPEPLRRPAWLLHPNGARAIRSCTVVAPHPAPVVEALRRLFGAAALTATDNVVAAHTGHGVVLVAPPEDALLMHPLLELSERVEEPLWAALTVEVADPERAATFLKLQGVPFDRSPAGDVLVPPGEACGVALELVRN
jgi:catechol 2,3-dioxygenase-like lactoylglutathione lyase family enzyme